MLSVVIHSLLSCISAYNEIRALQSNSTLEQIRGKQAKLGTEQNRPLNAQNVADALQRDNLKKTYVQKALDALCASGRITFKEYGKQKIYLARQDQFDIPNSEELDRMKKENATLQQNLEEQKRAISEVEGEIRALQSNLTLEQIRAKQAKLETEEELGIEYDEDVGVSLQSLSELMPQK